MTDKEYNDFFRSRLNAFSSGVEEKLWDNIKAENKRKRSQWLAVAKYIMPVIFLIFSLETADKMIVSDKGTAISFAETKKNKESISNVIKQSNETQEWIDNKMVSVLNRKVFKHLLNANKKRLKVPPVLTFTKYTSSTNQMMTDKIKQSDDLSGNINQRDTDNITNDVKKAIKKEATAPQKQTDSTADIIAETHDDADRFFLYLFASPDVALAHVTSANNSYQQLRNQQSKQQLSYSAGARLRVNINEHWSANIGVQYVRVNEKIKIRNSTSDNHSNSLDAPLIIGYRVYKKNFEIDANAGVVLNVSSSYSGYISSVNNEPVNVHLANVYKKNTSLGYYVGVQFLFKPDNKITFFAEPYFKYQPGNVVNAFQPFEEHVQKAGVWLGARYQFRK